MAELLAHYRADAVKIVYIGSYTKDTERFAQGEPIELMGGCQLREMTQAVQRKVTPLPKSQLCIEPVLVLLPSEFETVPVSPVASPHSESTLLQRPNGERVPALGV